MMLTTNKARRGADATESAMMLRLVLNLDGSKSSNNNNMARAMINIANSVPASLPHSKIDNVNGSPMICLGQLIY